MPRDLDLLRDFGEEVFFDDRARLSSSSESLYLSLWILKGFVNNCICDNKNQKDSPTIADHADALGLCFAVKFGSFLHIFLATDPFDVTEAGLTQCISVSPVASNLKHLSARALSCSTPQPLRCDTPSSYTLSANCAR